MQGVGDSSSPS